MSKSAQMLVEEKIKDKQLDKNIENMLMFASWAYFERYQPWNASQSPINDH